MKRLTGVIALIVLSGILLVLNSCKMDGAKELESIEIREYEGENLSSITDFRETSLAGPQYVDIESYRLEISGLVEKPVEYIYDEVIEGNQHYKKVVELECVEGWSARVLWEGILVKDLVEKAGLLPDTKVVIFHAYDGYTTSLPLDYIIDKNILVAYKINDVILPPENGFPFQLVAEDKWGYKWIKWLTKIELSDDINYEGYWESRGFSNSGDKDSVGK